MKKSIYVLFVVVLMAALRAEAAQNGASVKIGAYDFNDSISHSIFDTGGMVSLDYERFIHDRLSVGVDLNYTTADAKDPYYVDKLYFYSVLAKTRFYLTPEKSFCPYFEAGIGYLWSYMDSDFENKVYEDSGIAYEAAAGIRVRLYKELYLEGQTSYSTAYVLSNISARDQNIGGIMTGIGLAYRF